MSYGAVSITDVHIVPEIEGSYANAWITLDIQNHTDEIKQVVASFVVALGDDRETIEIAEWVPPEGGAIEAVIRIEQPQLWWPNGFGEQTLYTCLAGVQCNGEVEDVVQRRFAVREVRLAEHDRDGVPPFTLIINGEEVFCKGAYWIPSDDPDQCRRLLTLARDAHFNMLQLPGGACESSEFHEACDELGIMVIPHILNELDPSRPCKPPSRLGESWILQGESLKAEIEQRRREKRAVSGAILGVYNDCRPAIGGSLVDSHLRPNIEYYYVKRAFAPVLVSFKQLGGRAQAYVTSDVRTSDLDGALQVAVFTFGACGLDAEEIAVSLPANSSRAFWESPPLEELFAQPERQCIVAYLRVGDSIVARNVYFPRDPAEMDFPRPKLFVQREQIDDNTLAMSISSDDYARNVAIGNLPDAARISDNYFDLLPGEIAQVRIEGITKEQAAGLSVDVLRA